MKGVLLCVMFLGVMGCAEGGRSHVRMPVTDAGVPRPMDAGRVESPDAWIGVGNDAGQDAWAQLPGGMDAGVQVEPVMRETCNGLDDDADGRADEDFLCPMGRMGEICVTSCGANGYRVCEAPTCSWSVECHPFGEMCDTIDNDCDGVVDEGCPPPDPPPPPPPPAECSAIARHTTMRISLDPAIVGACAPGWTIILWGSGGAGETYRSDPGATLVVPVRTDWRGRLAMTAFCGDWTGVKNWSASEGLAARAAGVRITVDADDLSDEAHVCFDPGGLLIRPLIPVECPQPDCPGMSW